METGTNAEAMVVFQTPFCGALRSKTYFMLDVIATDADQFLDGSGHCWCYHTQHAIGPDGELVQPQDCQSNRTCYRSGLDRRYLSGV